MKGAKRIATGVYLYRGFRVARDLLASRANQWAYYAATAGSMPAEAPLRAASKDLAMSAIDVLLGADDGCRPDAVAEKKLAAIAMLVSMFERQRENEPDEGWPEGDLHPSQVLLAIGETLGQPCSICRSRHGSEVRHAAE